MPPHAQVRLWSATKRVTSVLLVMWLLLNVLGAWFARDLDRWMNGAFSIDFWMAAQAALPAYLLIIVVYVVAMERLESAAGEGDAANDGDDERP